MSVSSGLTAEMYQAVVAVVDDRVREIRVTRQDFDELKGVVSQLAQTQARTEERMGGLERAMQELAQAQARTEERMGGLERAMQELAQAQARTEVRLEELAQAQARTEVRLEELAQAQARTEVRLEELAQAQARTELALQNLAQRMDNLAQQVGRLSDNVGYGLEDMARSMLPGYLAIEFGFYFDVLRRRLFRVDGEVIELDLYSEGERDGQPAVLLGEVKSRIYRREVEQFLRHTTAVEPLVDGQVLRLMFGYFIDLTAMEAAGDDVLLIPSYEPTVRYHERRHEERRKRQQNP